MNDAVAQSSAEIVLELTRIHRTYLQGDKRLDVLRGASLRLHAREIVALVGPSGAGKSTLLHTAGLLEKPDSGQVAVLGRAVGDLGDESRTALRRTSIGFVYQFHHLLPEFSAEENIILPQMIAGVARPEAALRARALLDQVGLLGRATHRPAELSGGEQQRVALARALANRPRVLIADEPTGNLDPHTAGDVFEILRNLLHSEGLGALIATHNLELARRMDRVVELRDGLLVQQQ